MKNLLALFLVSLFVFALSCTETRYEQLKSRTSYGILPDWFGKVEQNTGGICAQDGCKDSEHPLTSAFCATGVDFVAIVGVDEVIPIRAFEEKNSEYHKGYSWSVEEIDHTHINLKIEKILLGDEKDVEGRLFYYQGINDPESGYRTPMCETCTGPMWKRERAIIFVSLVSSGTNDALIVWVLPFVSEDTINSRPAGGGKDFKLDEEINHLLSNKNSIYCGEKISKLRY